MKIDQIQIRTTDAKVDLNISKSAQYIKQPKANQTIEQPAATLEMHHTDAKLTVDSSQAYRDLGYFNNVEFAKNYAQAGESGVMEGIARRASEGEAMMNISKNSGNAMPSIAQSFDTFEQQRLGIEWKPSVGAVKIKYHEGSLDINIQAHKAKINTVVNKPIIDYTPGKVSGTLIQREDVDISVKKGE